MNSGLLVGLCWFFGCNQCLIIFYNSAAQDTTTQNYLCFASYYIVFKVLVEKRRVQGKTKSRTQQYTASAVSSSGGDGRIGEKARG